jgi:hypothetical protein
MSAFMLQRDKKNDGRQKENGRNKEIGSTYYTGQQLCAIFTVTSETTGRK